MNFLLIWLIGAGLTVTFIFGYLALGMLADMVPGMGIVLAIIGPLVGALFMIVSLAIALGLAGASLPVLAAILAGVLAGVTFLVSMSLYDEHSGWPFFVLLLVANVIGLETVLSVAIANGVSDMIGHLAS